MPLHRSVVVTVAVGMLLPLGPAATATATSSPSSAPGAAPSEPGPAPVVGDRTAAPPTAVDDYWSDQRLEAAEPLPLPHLDATGSAVPTTVRAGPSAVTTARATGEVWTGGGEVVRTTGRLYFTVGGADSLCSASVVAGARKDLLITAGHCLRSPGQWHRNVLFVPGYDRGSAPFGRWTAKKLWVTRQWFRDSSPRVARDFRFDVGFVALRPAADGRPIADVTGSQGIAFDTKGTPAVHAFGYPAERPFDGRRLRHCSGDTANDPYGRVNRRIPCSMNGGASGGPWLADFDRAGGTGVQISLNSYTYGNRARLEHMQGPRFGDVVRTVYLSLQPTVPDGTFLHDMTDGAVYRVAGGAPLRVTGWDAFGGPRPYLDVPRAYLTRKLRDVPRNVFLRGTAQGRIYRVHRGHPYRVASWGPWGGPQPYVGVDQAAIDRCDHLRCGPFGTLEVTRRGHVAGWAMDPNRARPVKVRVRVDGRLRTTVRADDRRRDVAELLHRGRRYGYSAKVRLARGRSTVCVTALNVGRGQDRRLGCRVVKR